MALYEMWEVSNLPMGSKSYEEYFTYTLGVGAAGEGQTGPI